MKKVIKLNNKGFALAEILVTTVFVMVIFSIIYVNYYPLMAEYEKRELFDDIDGKYAAFWFKKLIESNDYKGTMPNTSNASSNVLLDFSSSTQTESGISYNFCENNWTSYKGRCNELVKSYNITKVYITNYNISSFKSVSSLSEDVKDYLDSLPNFSTASVIDGVEYRVIVEMKRKFDENSKERSDTQGDSVNGNTYQINTSYQNEYFAYSTIGVKK